ncbi:double-stranded RNA-specific editase 1 isoform X3 [Penaeus vannamei]|uniref:double-stranded RNA-specific editase 1-like n=1 Tax=Penaeus vannamei TaxID=6689 RepID=UPI00387F9640
MRGRGKKAEPRSRGRSNWRSGAANTPQNEVPPPETFSTENSDTSAMDFYSQGLPEPSMDVNVPGSDSDASMQEGDVQETPSRKRPWERAGGKTKMKKKKVPGAKNLKIRRYVQPKNAVMCLNELRPGVAYTTEQEGGVGQPFCISVEITNGNETQKYRGFGSSKQLAKQAAAEAALISFVKPPVNSNPSEGPEEDKTPWATLASFAIYKLFNDWREGRVGMCPPPAQPYGAALPPGFQAFLGQSLGGTGGIKDESGQGTTTAFTEAICAHLGTRALLTPADAKEANLALQSTEATKVPKPAKQMPENAAAMHPVMVLHQMKPGLQYAVTQATKENKPYFTVSADIDGKPFTGVGHNVKKAKFILAKEAIQELYGIDSTFEAPA